MGIEISTPALLFPAISLLLLAYTNRFIALSSLIRNLHLKYQQGIKNKEITDQIQNLRSRLRHVRLMQEMGVLSLVSCVVSMFFLYLQNNIAGEISFVISLLFMLTSLMISLREVHISIIALNIELSDVEEIMEKKH